MGKKAHIIKKFLSKGYSEYFLSKLWIKEKNTRRNNGRRKRRIFGSNDYPKEDKGLLKLQAAINELINDDFFDIYDEE